MKKDLHVGITIANRIHHEAIRPGGKHTGCSVLQTAAGSDYHQQ